ncbi:MAG: hypothetical protein CFE21_10975 [Bacteroidetes bacterium B1(2017)]|nr:MAG: hypothetical protein CFE21_10975 [Bacteroidetes bacterium B1(2017)]
MKKLIAYSILAISGLFTLNAQDKKPIDKDALIAPWFIEGNLRLGTLNQALTQSNWEASYVNPLNAHVSNLKASNSSTLGADLQLGYFFGKRRHFGLGTGIVFLSQRSTLGMENYHIEYQSTDSKGAIFRQSISAKSDFKETIKTNSFSIPVVLKYKKQLTTKWGVNLDAGVLFNIKSTSTYTNTSKIDYEAIYKFDGAGNPIYDNASTPDPNDWLITKDHYEKVNTDGDVNAYFEDLFEKGYNVGLGVSPNKTKGDGAKQTVSIGFIIQPSVSYMLAKNLALHGSLYYISYGSENANTSNYKLTDIRGEYSSMTNGISKTNTQSIGFALGLRYYFGEPRIKDRDHDGVLDKEDHCIDVPGSKKSLGCPDSDGDGVVDADDKCPQLSGTEAMKGCPDADGDGIADVEDKCPQTPGLASLNGCPDADGDGVTDAEDKCANIAGSKEHNGCPDSDADGIFDDEDKCLLEPGVASNNGCPVAQKDIVKEMEAPKLPLGPTVGFATGKSTVDKESIDKLDAFVLAMKQFPTRKILVNGYADNIGGKEINQKISLQRAKSVADYLISKGINPKNIIPRGFGSENPIGDNKTEAGRKQNRRVQIEIGK